MSCIKVARDFIAPKTPFEESKDIREVHSNGIHLLGFGFDGTACFRKGTRNGPDAIRDIVYGIEFFSPYLNKDLEDLDNLIDLGNLPIGESDDIEKNWFKAVDTFNGTFEDIDLKKENVRLLTLGGEHSISYPMIKKYLNDFDDLLLVHLDAHADLRDGYLGFKYSHASIIKRSLDHFGPGHQLVQYGIRSGTREEFEYMRDNKTLITSHSEFLSMLNEISPERPIYLTFDLDFFDPSVFPGTGTPEPGGCDFNAFIDIVKILENKNLVGADVVELSPEIDSTGNSSVFAAKVIREILLAF